jgi:tetratricopeptide (TPR) repeat protein
MKLLSGPLFGLRLLSYAVLAGIVTIPLPARGNPQRSSGDPRAEVRRLLNEGVEAYKNAEFDRAIEDFKKAKELDPWLTNARLYLAKAYANLYIPGAPSEENRRNAELAIQEFKEILQKNPNDLSAIDGIGSILYNMAGTPFDAQKMQESKSYHQKHIQLRSDDPEPYYWIGVIDWMLCYHANRDMREEYNKKARTPVKESDAMPKSLSAEFASAYGATVDEGIANLQNAMKLRSDYDDAMAYLNLLYRQKVDMESTVAAREADLRAADELVDKVKAVKQRKANWEGRP